MLKSLKKHSYRFVVVLLLLTTLLTFDVGRVTKVEAVATTAAIVGEVLLGLGVTYIAYQTLTGANVFVPGYEETDMYEYIRGLGRDFSHSASGSSLFSDLYNKLVVDDTYSVVDFTQDRLRDIYNDHKSISDMQLESSFDFTSDLIPLNGYDYSFSFISVPQYIGSYSFSYLISIGRIINQFNGVRFIYNNGYNFYSIEYSDLDNSYQYRNVKKFNGKYGISRSLDGINWSSGSYTFRVGYEYYDGSIHQYLTPNSTGTSYRTLDWNVPFTYVSEWDYPVLPDLRVFDETTQEYLPLVPADSSGNQLTPQYPQNDDGNNKYPIVPYVQLPNTQKWGFNWRDALTDLINGGSRLLTYSWIADLINDFKNSLSGSGDDIDYNYYNEGDTYYVTYYSTTVNDIDNPVYNINVSEQEDVIPVDLNTIQKYTDNQYLTLIKERAETFGETFGELVAFWHNCDPEIVYAFLGASIIVLLGAFIGKWGHS